MDFINLNEAIRVRQANPADLQVISEIWLEGVGSAFGIDSSLTDRDSANIHEQILRLILQQDDTFKFWVCVDETGQVIGWSTVQPFHTTPWKKLRESYGFISTYLSKNTRSKGVGEALLKFVIDYCRANTQIGYVLGLQDRANVASVKISDRTGFLDYGKLPSQPGMPDLSIIVCPTKP